MRLATGCPNEHLPNPHWPFSAVICTQTSPPPKPGILDGIFENWGYLFIGKILGAYLFHESLQGFVLIVGLGKFIFTARYKRTNCIW